MNYKRSLIAICAGWFVSFGSVHSAHHPEDFDEFFTPSKEKVSFSLKGEKRDLQIDAIVTYDTFKVVDKEENISNIYNYLKLVGIKSDKVSLIVSRLKKGIFISENCQVDFSSCVPESPFDFTAFDFNFDNKEIIVYVSSDQLSGLEVGSEYHQHVRADNALINNSEIYAFYSEGGEANLTFSNETKLGLPYGFFDFDTQIRTSDDSFDVNRAVYDVEWLNKRVVFGYSSFAHQDMNSTDFFNYGADYSGTSIVFGSSSKLAKKSENFNGKLYFFSHQDGQLEVYREGDLIYTRTVGSGQQHISYSDLPHGVYDVEIFVKNGGDLVLRETRKVVNHADFSMPIGSFDYVFQAGYLDDIDYDSFEVRDSSRLYGKLSGTFRAKDSLIFGGSLMGNNESSAFQVGGYWTPHELFDLRFHSSLFDSGASYHSGQLKMKQLNLSFKRVNNKDKSGLSRFLYSDDRLTEVGVNFSGSIIGGYGYLSYAHTVYDDKNKDGDKKSTVSSSFSRPFLGGNLSLSLFYSHSDTADDWSTSFSWSRSFGEASARYGYRTSDDGEHDHQASISYDFGSDNHRSRITTTARRLNKEEDVDISLSSSGHFDSFRYNAYAFVDTNSNRSISGSLSGTQVVSRDFFGVTYLDSDSFLTVYPVEKKPLNTLGVSDVSYVVSKNGNSWLNGSVTIGKHKNIALKSYNNYVLDLSGESSNAEIENNHLSAFSLPATHHKLFSNVTSLSSQLFILSDKSGNAISSASCNGDGCRGVEQVSHDGVFRVNYLNGSSFKVNSNDLLCDYSVSDLGSDYINAVCVDKVMRVQ